MISISQYLLAVSAGRAMLSHELDASQFVRHARRASFKDPRPERASRVDLPVPSRYLSPALRPHKSFSCNTYKKPGEGAVGNVFPHHGAFNTASHLPYALPSSASRKSFACRSYENTRGVGVLFPLARSCSGHSNPQHQSLSPYLVTSTHPRRSRPFRRKLNHAVS
jgi:hypothetical protein